MKAVLFDLDGTVTDRPASIRAFARWFRARFGQRLGDITDESLSAEIERADGGGYRPRAEMFADLEGCLPWRLATPAALIEACWWENFPASTVAPAGLGHLLRSLTEKSVSLGVITNGGTGAQNAKIDALGIRPLLSVVVISEESGLEKPAPEIFMLALDRLDVRPPEACFVGDNPDADVLGAQAAGMRAIWLSGGRPWPHAQASPDLEVASIRELHSLGLDAWFGLPPST